MRKLILFIFPYLILFACQGQESRNISLQSSKYVNFNKLGFYLDGGNPEILYYRFNHDSTILFVDSYSQNLSRLKTREIPLPEYIKIMTIEEVKLSENLISIVSHFYDKKENKTYFYRESFDLSTLKSTGNLKMFLDFNGNIFNSSFCKILKRNQKVLYFFADSLTIYDSIQNISFAIIDSTLNIIHQEQNFLFPFDKTVTVDDVTFSDSTLVLLNKEYQKSTDYFLKDTLWIEFGKFTSFNIEPRQNYIYSLTEFNFTQPLNNDKRIITHKINPFDYHIRKAGIFMTKENSILLYGITTSAKNRNVNGIFSGLFQLGYPSEFHLIKVIPFTMDYVNLYKTKKELRQINEAKKSGLSYDNYSYKFQPLMETESGFILMIEQELKFTISKKSKDGWELEPFAKRDDLHVLFIGSNGGSETLVKVPKRQLFGGSFTALSGNMATTYFSGNLHIFVADIRYMNYNGRKTQINNIIHYTIGNNRILTQEILPVYKHISSNILLTNNWLNDYTNLSLSHSMIGQKGKIIQLNLPH